MKKGEKQGQFYLIAAIIIITAIVGIAVVSNYVRTRPRTTIYYLGQELEIEGGYVVDYGILKAVDMGKYMENFTTLYAEYIAEGRDVYFVYGDKETMWILGPEEWMEGTITAGQSGVIIKGRAYGREELKRETENEESDEIIVPIGEEEYTFKLKPGQNFYFVIVELFEGEKYIITL